MSVQISYKKQTMFFIISILVVLTALELTIRIYDYYDPNCNFVNSDVFTEVDENLKLQICRDNVSLQWEINPLLLIPNQNLDTITVNSDGFRGNELLSNPDLQNISIATYHNLAGRDISGSVFKGIKGGFEIHSTYYPLTFLSKIFENDIVRIEKEVKDEVFIYDCFDFFMGFFDLRFF